MKRARRTPKSKSELASERAEVVTGKLLTYLQPGLALIQSRSVSVSTRPSDTAGVLLSKLGEALDRPGLRRRDVFGECPHKNVYAYYVDERNPDKMIRESFGGKRTSGTVVGGKFRAE